MEVLVLGGTVFLGRAVVSEALAVDARVTVFNRGQSGPVPDGVEHVRGDRTVPTDLEALRGRTFDVVVDTSGYVPAVVGPGASLLAETCGRYAFVSSINVYPGWPEAADYRVGGTHDGDPDASSAPPEFDPGAAYGWLKVGCERTVSRAFGDDRVSILRAGCIVGPHDGVVGRLPWWIDRVARGGQVLVPGAPHDAIALVDARDLARFALVGPPGVFETGGPAGRDTRADLMAAAAEATGTTPSLTYVDTDWLADQDVEPWTEVPLWAPNAPSLFVHHNEAAASAGFDWRPLEQTVTDTWAWMQSIPGGWSTTSRTPGVSAAAEDELLRKYHDS